MTLVYIHGANASSASFNYIKSKIDCPHILIDYDSKDGFQKNLDSMRERLKDEKSIFFICHSLGGVYALHLTSEMPENVKGAVTLSTPYGGAEVAELVKYFLPYSQLLKDIEPKSWVMRRAGTAKIKHPWINIVTTRGNNPLMPKPNDGVVTVSSQRSRKDIMDLIEIDCNHYEVVLNDQVISIINEQLKRIHA